MKKHTLAATTATALLLALASLPALAQTDSVSYTVPLPEIDEFVFLDPFSFGESLSYQVENVPKFDPALGTLVDVEISFNYDVGFDIYLFGEGIFDDGIPHQIEWSLNQLAVGVSYVSTAQDPSPISLLGDVDKGVGLGCFGEPFQGFSCEEFDFLGYVGGPVGFSLVNSILLSDFVGTGNFDGFTFIVDFLGSQFFLNNIGTGFVDIGLFQSSSNTDLTIEYFYTTAAADADEDGVADSLDNCVEVANPGQQDADGDGYGNACDADVNNDCTVNAGDLGLLRAGFFGSDPLLDFNSDGAVNPGDLGIMKQLFFGTPGPSGPGGACDIGTSALPGEPVEFQRDEVSGSYSVN